MANWSVDWAAYRALMSGRLVGFDKMPGVRPLGIGDVLRRLIAKCIIFVTRSVAKTICKSTQLCAGLEGGVEGGVHAMEHLVSQHKDEEDWGFLVIDARNAFNELNRTLMLYVVRHEWAAGAMFTFNCYKRYPTLILRGLNGDYTLIHSKEGVTQGDPLSMYVYALSVLPLIRAARDANPWVVQSWFADDSAGGADFPELRRHLEYLGEHGPTYGFYPELDKSKIVVPPEKMERANEYFSDLGLKVVEGARYLGGFIGSEEKKVEWLQPKVENWVHEVECLAGAAASYPQSAYCALTRAVQSEWQYVQRVVPGISPHFAKLNETLVESFLPALFGEPLDDPNDPRLHLASLPVKHGGLGISNPQGSAKDSYLDSRQATEHLVASILGESGFNPGTHQMAMRNNRNARRELVKRTAEAKLQDVLQPLGPELKRCIKRSRENGRWLTVTPSVSCGTTLSKQEFQDSLLLRYGRTPLNLPAACDGCGKTFSVSHGLQCKKGGLIFWRHEEVKNELAYLAGRAMAPSAVRNEPLIYVGAPRTGTSSSSDSTEGSAPNPDQTDGDLKDLRGDLLIRGAWAPGTDLIIDTRVVDTDSKSYITRDPSQVLKQHEREKKNKYLKPCIDQRRHFTPFVVSTDGLIATEGTNLLKMLAARLSKKTQRPYSQVCGFVNARMSIAIVRATHFGIRGSRVPTGRMSARFSEWDDGAGLGMLRA